MSGEYCSTSEAADRSGATFRQLDYWVKHGYVRPPIRSTLNEADDDRWSRKWDDRRWRPVDVAAASVIGGLIASGPDSKSTALASLAARSVYAWHGRAPWVVVALPDVLEPCWSAEDAVAVASGHTVCTVVPLEVLA